MLLLLTLNMQMLAGREIDKISDKISSQDFHQDILQHFQDMPLRKATVRSHVSSNNLRNFLQESEICQF